MGKGVIVCSSVSVKLLTPRGLKTRAHLCVVANKNLRPNGEDGTKYFVHVRASIQPRCNIGVVAI